MKDEEVKAESLSPALLEYATVTSADNLVNVVSAVVVFTAGCLE